MKEIKLTQGQVAIVDDWRYEELNKYNWQARLEGDGRYFYAIRSLPRDKNGKRKTIMMHSVVAGTPSGMKTDHINHNTLDNREANLRACSHSQNLMNRGKTTSNTSGYKGVFKRGNVWMAQIKVDGTLIYLGRHKTAEDAAIAYDNAAKIYHGEFAKLNFPDTLI